MITESTANKVALDDVATKYFAKLIREHVAEQKWNTVKLLVEDENTWFADDRVTWRRGTL